MDISKYVTDRSRAVEWSGIRVMFALADEIPDVVNLGIGQPDFDTPAFIREAAKQGLDEGYTRYPPAKGFADLRRAVAEKLKKENNINADPDSEIFVAVGAMQVIFNTVLHLVEAGDEVLVVDPRYDCSELCRCRYRLTREMASRWIRLISKQPSHRKQN